jgi:hypothetical protein
MMDNSNSNLRSPLLSIPNERDAGVGDDDVGRSGMHRTTRSIYSAINLFCLYIQFRLVYYVMVNTGENVTHLAWRAIERNMLFFVTIYVWYRVLRTGNRNTVISTVLQSLPDVIIAILMILLLFRLLETAVVFMQQCTIILAIIALWSSRSSTVDLTTATTGTPMEKEQSNSTRPRCCDDSYAVNSRSFAVIV